MERKLRMGKCGETEIFRKHLSLCHFVLHKSHMYFRCIETESSPDRQATSCLNGGTDLKENNSENIILLYTNNPITLEALHYVAVHYTALCSSALTMHHCTTFDSLLTVNTPPPHTAQYLHVPSTRTKCHQLFAF
jgi:hypothetical protein